MAITPFKDYIGCSSKFPVKVGIEVEESIVNALRITDHGSADKWCVHN
jgi:hypothetical protein